MASGSLLVRAEFDWRSITPTPPYPNDSLRWVAAEVRYPPLDEFTTTIPPGFRDQLRDRFPIHEEQHRYVARDRLMSVTIGRDAVTLETTEYSGWTEFSGLFADVLAALEAERQPDGILRVGLRYIDEVRLPDPPASLDAWSGWINDRLVAPFALDEDAQLTNGTVVLQYGEPPGYVTIFRGAPFAAGRTVLQEGTLRMPVETPDGPYFLLDTDASWADPDRQIPEFAIDHIAEVFDELHSTCARLFEASITDQLRNAVLNRPREEVWGT
jgi:uncharacterized protein (TIGR04255 family)